MSALVAVADSVDKLLETLYYNKNKVVKTFYL